MNVQSHPDEVHDLDEGSWVYLSLRGQEQRAERDLYQRVIEACEESGWPAVSWSPTPHQGNVVDSARYFEGMSHAVEHADAVIVLLDSPSPMTDVELAFAYSHNRPVVGLRVGSRDPGSEVQSMLRRHGRACVIDGVNVEECVGSLRKVLADPQFGATIRQAAGGEAHV